MTPDNREYADSLRRWERTMMIFAAIFGLIAGIGALAMGNVGAITVLFFSLLCGAFMAMAIISRKLDP